MNDAAWERENDLYNRYDRIGKARPVTMEDAYCVTCCFGYDADLTRDQNDDAHLEFDGAHSANWSDEPSEERDIMNALIDGTWS